MKYQNPELKIACRAMNGEVRENPEPSCKKSHLRNQRPKKVSRSELRHRLAPGGLIPRSRHHPASQVEEANFFASSASYFEHHFHYNRDSKWKTCNAKNHSHRKLVFSEDITQQFGGSI